MANGKNGNILEGYYSNRNKPDWTLVLALLGVIGTLIGVIWFDSKERTDLKIENAKLKWTNEFLNQTKQHQYVPDGYR